MRIPSGWQRRKNHEDDNEFYKTKIMVDNKKMMEEKEKMMKEKRRIMAAKA